MIGPALPGRIARFRLLAALTMLTLLPPLFLAYHVREHPIDSFEWAIEVGLIALSLLTLAYCQRLRRTLMREWHLRERLAIAQEVAGVGSWERDLRTDAVVWSRETYRIFGVEPGRFRPSLETFRGIVHPDDWPGVKAAVARAVETGEMQTTRYRVLTPGRAHRLVESFGRVVFDQGRASKLVGTAQDITEREQAERLKRDFVSFATHQLRTPLSGISWMLELAIDRGDLPAQTEGYLRGAHRAAGRLTRMVNDLLNVARLESGKLTAAAQIVSVDQLTRLVGAEFQALLDDKQQDFAIRAPSPVAVLADPALLREVIENLISNAVKYTPRGGRIAIDVTNKGGRLLWMIRDTGVGVPPEARQRVFDKFFRAPNVISIDTEGTGLGLHLVKLAIEHHGGRVWCESDPGRGATFVFMLPTHSEAISA